MQRVFVALVRVLNELPTRISKAGIVLAYDECLQPSVYHRPGRSPGQVVHLMDIRLDPMHVVETVGESELRRNIGSVHRRTVN
jgi:hypothetical protein